MAEQEAVELSKLIEDLALKAMSTETNDVAGLGEILLDIEKIKVSSYLPAPLNVLSSALVCAVESLIVGQGNELAPLMDCLLEGFALLQDRMKTGAEDAQPAIIIYLDRLKTFGVIIENHEVKPSEETTPKSGSSEEQAQGKIESKMEKNIIMDADTCYEFIAETLGNFDEAEATMIDLEEDPRNKEHINALFRFFHTAKGVSGFLNLKRMNHFAHELENLLDEVRNDRILFAQGIADFILKSMDFLKSMLHEVKDVLDQGGNEEPCYDVESHVKGIAELLGCERDGALETGTGSRRAGKVVGETGEAETRQTKACLETKVSEISASDGESPADDEKKPLKKQTTMAQDMATVRVSTSKLDNVVDMVGELVIAESLVFQNPLVQAINDQQLFKDFSQLHRITSELQKTAMGMRMVPIRQTFQKMIRLVRDLSKKAGKSVNLYMSGEETEIDRHMVDEIYDPLVHMLRNAVDHGIEPPEERVASGKDPKGNITLRAFHQGGHLFIEIRDDGKGLNREKIYAKAIEKKLTNPNDKFTDKEVYNFILLPGFSTAEKITDISGRGVGMDVVKKFIDKIRGSIDIDSKPGKGTVFTIKLPLTLAIIDGIIIMLGQERYIIPTMAVKESIQIGKNRVHTVIGKGEVINIRGRILPLLRLHHIMGVEPSTYNAHEGIIVVLEHDNEEYGLLIDRLVGKQEVVIKSLGKQFIETRGFSGGAILGDGRVGLILDVKGLLELSRELDSQVYLDESHALEPVSPIPVDPEEAGETEARRAENVG